VGCSQFPFSSKVLTSAPFKSAVPQITLVESFKMGLRNLAVLSLFFSSKLITATAEVDTYDYIVVGSDPGGGPLASNLAKSGATVLLLEAGDDQSKNMNETVGGLFNQANNDPLMRWDFFIKYHTDPTLDAQYDHLTWRTTDGQFYVGLNPPAGAKQLGV
jgi:choline dehydrogenase